MSLDILTEYLPTTTADHLLQDSHIKYRAKHCYNGLMVLGGGGSVIADVRYKQVKGYLQKYIVGCINNTRIKHTIWLHKGLYTDVPAYFNYFSNYRNLLSASTLLQVTITHSQNLSVIPQFRYIRVRYTEGLLYIL
jgi:hypothetical protein